MDLSWAECIILFPRRHDHLIKRLKPIKEGQFTTPTAITYSHFTIGLFMLFFFPFILFFKGGSTFDTIYVKIINIKYSI